MTSGSNPLIEVFVLCYNRKEFVAESIRSVLAQTYQRVQLILSDNSTTDEVSEFLRNEFPTLELRRRKPSLSNYDHLNLVLAEANAKYLMIFHDDDILEPSYIADLIAELEKNGASAGCANARLLIDGKKTDKLFNQTLRKNNLISNPRDLAKNYLDYSYGVNPFPGYIYRRGAIQGLRFDLKEAGQYCDVTFLVKVAQTGAIFWSARPAMFYRKHGGNVSGNISIVAMKRMIRFLVEKGIYSKTATELRLFRYWNHLFSIRNRKRRNLRSRRPQIELTLKYFTFHPVPLIRKAMQKLNF